jgi:acyl-CoA reductase-like NAD-dependent aldehyde dehydrogenase
MSKQSLVVLLIGLVVGGVCAFSVAQALAKRGAYPRAAMIVLARHVDHLRGLEGDTACTSDRVWARMQQVHFAAREIDWAFANVEGLDDGFARRSREFQAATVVPEKLGGCADLAAWLENVRRGCQACHRDYR